MQELYERFTILDLIKYTIFGSDSMFRWY